MCILNLKGDKLLKRDIVLKETIYRYLTEASVPKTYSDYQYIYTTKMNGDFNTR